MRRPIIRVLEELKAPIPQPGDYNIRDKLRGVIVLSDWHDIVFVNWYIKRLRKRNKHLGPNVYEVVNRVMYQWHEDERKYEERQRRIRRHAHPRGMS